MRNYKVIQGHISPDTLTATLTHDGTAVKLPDGVRNVSHEEYMIGNTRVLHFTNGLVLGVRDKSGSMAFTESPAPSKKSLFRPLALAMKNPVENGIVMTVLSLILVIHLGLWAAIGTPETVSFFVGVAIATLFILTTYAVFFVIPPMKDRKFLARTRGKVILVDVADVHAEVYRVLPESIDEYARNIVMDVLGDRQAEKRVTSILADTNSALWEEKKNTLDRFLIN